MAFGVRKENGGATMSKMTVFDDECMNVTDR